MRPRSSLGVKLVAVDDLLADGHTRGTAWNPPLWLRKLHVAAAEHTRASASEMSPEHRLRLVCELMSFALARLHEQAERRGCTVGDLLRTYEQAASRLRARA
jgi:hypothetical protein